MSYSFLSESQPPEFRVGAVRPFQCLSSGWQTIKDQYFLFAGMSLIILLLVTCVPLTGIIWGAWMCGIYTALFARMRGETATFNAIGQGFQHFGPAFGVAILNNLPFVPVLVAGKFLESWLDEMDQAYPADELPPEVLLQMLAYIGAVVLFYIICTLVTGVIFAFAYQLVVDKNMSAWEATKLSVRAARENFGGVVGLVFLELVLSAAGLLFCCFGLVLVMPLTKAAWAIAYAQVFPMSLPPAPAQQPPPPPPPVFYGNPPYQGGPSAQ